MVVHRILKGVLQDPITPENVVVDSSGLPSGAATAGNQTTGNTSLSTIAGAVAGTEMQVDVASPIDTASGAVTSIDYPHHKIHDGSSFIFNETTVVGNGATRELVINAPDTATRIHFFMSIASDVALSWVLYRDTTHTNNVQQAVLNRDENSGNAATATVYTHNDDNVDGTPRVTGQFGGGQGSGKYGGETRNDGERILLQAARYLLIVSNGSGGAGDVTINFDWYEKS